MEHVVRVVEDGALATRAGWAMARTDDGEMYFLVERSAACSEKVLKDAWDAAATLEDPNSTLEKALMVAQRQPSEELSRLT